MNSILCYGLQAIVHEHYEDFAFSLNASGIDVKADRWRPELVTLNAAYGAESLLRLAAKDKHNRLIYLRTIIDGCDAGKYVEIMAYIFIIYELNNAPPPYGIIQHAIKEELLKEYCIALRQQLASLAGL